MTYDSFHESNLYTKILTKKQSMFKFVSRLPCHALLQNHVVHLAFCILFVGPWPRMMDSQYAPI